MFNVHFVRPIDHRMRAPLVNVLLDGSVLAVQIVVHVARRLNVFRASSTFSLHVGIVNNVSMSQLLNTWLELLC